jgi:hypothetical protein
MLHVESLDRQDGGVALKTAREKTLARSHELRETERRENLDELQIRIGRFNIVPELGRVSFPKCPVASQEDAALTRGGSMKFIVLRVFVKGRVKPHHPEVSRELAQVDIEDEGDHRALLYISWS